MTIYDVLSGFKFNYSEWTVHDLRIDIPPLSYGSDAANTHTQYSNPLVFLERESLRGLGASFSLGRGNEQICANVRYILKDFDGLVLGDLLSRQGVISEKFANPSQLRWLSPNSGPVYMAGAVILNTLLDWAAKKLGLPLWEALCREPTNNLLKFISTTQYSPFLSISEIKMSLDNGLVGIEERIQSIKSKGMPVYYTTWLGRSSLAIREDINKVHSEKGITCFKIKVNDNTDSVIRKLKNIFLPFENRMFRYFSDANQTLKFNSAVELARSLANLQVEWLEEPFAPDNVRLHRELRAVLHSEGSSMHIVTGENCPNAHTAIEFIQTGGCDRFQVDACRVMSICDLIPIMVAAAKQRVPIVPHAGGSALDELVTHLTAFNFCRVSTSELLDDTLTEHVGFCSRFFKFPASVASGRASCPVEPGYLCDVSDETYAALAQPTEEKWLKF
jgi:L-alanine-DL-glutamate epimerase-like enolase superfamily enzyme